MVIQRRAADRRKKRVASRASSPDAELAPVPHDRRSYNERRINQAKRIWQQSESVSSSNKLLLWLGETIIQIHNNAPDYIIGRTSTCEIILNHRFLSHQHACIRWQNDACVLVDHSRNGTYVRTDDVGYVHLRDEYIFLTGRGHISFGVPIGTCKEHHIMHYSCQ